MKHDKETQLNTGGRAPKIVRGGMQIIGGIVPFAGGLFSAAAGAWSENEQEKANKFFQQWLKMLEDEIKEKEKTIIEIMMRLDIHDEEILKRIESNEYKSLLKKTFREWSGTESEEKREYIRNILSNAAATTIASDDVIRLFIDWIKKYSELHFHVIASIYNTNGITRGEIWEKIGKGPVREDSAEADLYRLLFSDLNIGRIIRQHREVSYNGAFLKKQTSRVQRSSSSREMKSAFDREEKYVLTGLGQQFVHYAMIDLPLKIEFKPKEEDNTI